MANTGSPSTFQYAGFWRRFLASFIDGIVLLIISASISIPFAALKNDALTVFSRIISLLISAGYYIFFWTNQDGQTLGKRLLAVKVIKENGGPIDIGTAVVRYIGYLISGFVLFLGFLWIGWDKRKQGWHDKIARTLVVKTGKKPHTGIALSVVIIFFLFIVLFIGAITTLFYQAYKNPRLKRSLETSFNKIMPTLSQEKANERANVIFSLVNQYREKNGFPSLLPDNKLCAYAVRRLQELSSLTQYDSGKGFYEDLANLEVKRAYFTDFTYVGQQYFPLTSVTQPQEVISSWTQTAGTLNDPKYNYGCAMASSTSIILIAAQHK